MTFKGKKQLVNFWDKTREYYEITKFVQPEGTFKTIVELNRKSDLTLEIGSGLAQLSNFLDSYYIGVDISKLPLKLAQKNFNTHLINADTEKLPFKDKIFDKILIINSLEHFFTPKSILFEIYRVCKSNGLIILHGPAYDFPLSCPPSIISSLQKKSKININVIKFYLKRIKNYVLNLMGFENISANVIENPNPVIKDHQFISDSDVVYLTSIKEILNYLKQFPGKLIYVRHGPKWYNKFKFGMYWFVKMFLIFQRK